MKINKYGINNINNKMEKICNKCQINKTYEHFHKDKSKKDGHRNQCKECELAKKKVYYQENKEKILNYEKQRYNENEQVRIKKKLNSTLNMALKSKGVKECTSIINLSGCELEFFKNWLKFQYKILNKVEHLDWGDIKNKYKIFHVASADNYDLSDFKQQQDCFHYTNLQPLFKTTEIAKSFGYTDQIGNRNKNKY